MLGKISKKMAQLTPKKFFRLSLKIIGIFFILFAIYIGIGIVYLNKTNNIRFEKRAENDTKFEVYDWKEIGDIGPATETILKAYLLINNEKVLITEDKYTKQLYRISDYDPERSFKYQVTNSFTYDDNYIYYFGKNSTIFKINKRTKGVQEYKVPIQEGPNYDGVYTDLEKFSDNWLKVNDTTNDENLINEDNRWSGRLIVHFINTENNETYTTNAFNDCDIPYCSGLYFESQLNEDEFLVSQYGGDSCYGATLFYKYNIKTDKRKPFAEYTYFCGDSNDEFLGLYDNQTIHAKHKWTDWEENGHSYLNISATDIITEKTITLLDEKDIPEMKYMDLNKESGIVTMTDFDDNRYTYDLKLNELTKIENTGIKENENQANKMYDKFLKDNKEFLFIEKDIIELWPATKAYVHNNNREKPIEGDYLKIIDKDGKHREVLVADQLHEFMNIKHGTSENGYYFIYPKNVFLENGEEIEFNFARAPYWSGPITTENKWQRGKINIRTGKVYIDQLFEGNDFFYKNDSQQLN